MATFRLPSVSIYMHSMSGGRQLILGSSSAVRFSRSFTQSSAGHKETFSKQVRDVSQVPGPRSYPIIGNTPYFLKVIASGTTDAYKMYQELFETFGRIFSMRVPGIPPLVMISDADEYEKFYKVTSDMPRREFFTSLKKIRYTTASGFFQNRSGLLPENGEEWWRLRSRVQTHMMKLKNVAMYLPQVDNIALDFIKRIEGLRTQNEEMPENFLEEIYKFSLEAIAVVALSRRLGCLDPDLPSSSLPLRMIETVHEFFTCIHNVEMGSQLWRHYETRHFKRLRRAHEDLFEIALESIKQTEEEIRKRRPESDEMTMLERFLNTPGLTKSDATTMILDMLMAGVDTTSNTLGFTLYLLARNPDAQRRLQQEVDSILGDGKHPLTESDLKRMSYLKGVVKESLRLYPLGIGIGRILPTDTEFCGYLIPKGYNVVVLHVFASKDERIFPKAEEFHPERWMRDQPLGPIHPYASLPFSYGTRMCIGRRLAEQELYTLLARIASRYTVGYHHEDMGVVTQFVFKPSLPLKFTFTPRKK